MKPSSISWSRMPPLWFISTSPETFLTLQVPHRPNSHAAGIRTPRRPRRLQHRLAGDAFAIDIGQREADRRCRLRYSSALRSAVVAIGAGSFVDQRRAKALLVVVRHVEAGRLQHAAHRAHERVRAAAEHLAVAEIRRQQRQAHRIDAAHMAEPAFAARPLLDHEAERQAGHAAAQQLQLLAEDDLLGPARAVDEGNVGPRRAIVQPAQHRHHRRDAGAGRHEQVFRRRVVVHARNRRPDRRP